MKFTKRIIALILIGMAVLCSCAKKEVKNTAPQKAIFSSDEFKGYVAETLGKPAEELTQDDLDEIVGLDVYFWAERIENTMQYKDVCSITLLKEGFDEVSEIYYNTPKEERDGLETPQDYSFNVQTDDFDAYDDIKLLKNLKSISLYSEYILMEEDPVKYFSDITGLEDVSLYNYAVEDLEEIAKLTELETLGISINLRNIPDGVDIEYIEDLTPLKSLTKLKSLSLGGNIISDLSPISEIESITSLSITNAALSDISPVAKMKNLVDVTFYYNGIVDVTPLTKLPKLESIHLDYNYIDDLSPFAELDPNVVKYVSVDMNAFSDDTPLKHLGKEKINLGYSPSWDYE